MTAKFTPEIQALIRIARMYGAPQRAIAKAINTTENSVSARCAQLGIRRSGYLGVQVGEKVAAIFAQEAHRRGLTPSLLTTKIVHTVATANLFNAVLDDGSDPEIKPDQPWPR